MRNERETKNPWNFTCVLLHAFVECWLIKHRDMFTFTLINCLADYFYVR